MRSRKMKIEDGAMPMMKKSVTTTISAEVQQQHDAQTIHLRCSNLDQLFPSRIGLFTIKDTSSDQSEDNNNLILSQSSSSTR